MMGRINQAGFTLLELAIVLLILGLALYAFLVPLSTSLEQRNREETRARLVEIHTTLMGFVMANGHFPCPDIPTNAGLPSLLAPTTVSTPVLDGRENGRSATSNTDDRTQPDYECSREHGFLPWITLGVPETDAWNNPFYYSVTDVFSDNARGTRTAIAIHNCETASPGNSFCLDSIEDGNFNIRRAIASTTAITADTTNDGIIAENIPAVVFSLGNNAGTPLGNLSGAEQENRDDDYDFVVHDYLAPRSANDEQFDDLLIWVNPAALQYHMVRAGRLP